MRLMLTLGIILLMISGASAAPRNEVVTVTGRPGVTQSTFITYDDDHNIDHVVILFPGSYGLIKIRNDNGKPNIKIAGNFLVRSRNLFVDNGVAAIIVDSPSDEPEGMSDEFRTSKAHAADISAVIDMTALRFPSAKIFLIGTSRGTISAIALSGSLAHKINGVVLTSAVYEAPGFYLPRSLKVPALLVHHIDDGCPACPYSSAQQAAKKLKIPLITITGGKQPISVPCEAYSQHGFYGKEPETVASIVAWIRAQ